MLCKMSAIPMGCEGCGARGGRGQPLCRLLGWEGVVGMGGLGEPGG